MGLLVLPHRLSGENPVPRPTARDHGAFVWASLVRGSRSFTGAVALITTVAGGSLVAYALVVRNLPLPWVATILLGGMFLTFAIGACSLYAEARAIAIRFRPSWEPLQQRADTLWAIYNSDDSDDAAAFRARFAASHSVAAQNDFDDAAKMGFPLVDVTRDDIRHAARAELPRIAAAFEDAATRLREFENGA